MPNLAQKQLLYLTQSDFNTEFAEYMQDVADEVNQLLNRYADPDGTVPMRQALSLIDAVSNVVSQLFLSGSYATLLMAHMEEVQHDTLEVHRRFIRSHVSDEVYTWLQGAVYQDRPKYVKLDKWTDQNGRDLYERILAVMIAARSKITKYLTYNLQIGTPITRMSRDLYNMIMPDRNVLPSTVPSGVNVSFEASRLGRTEITRAYAELTFGASRINPFIEGMDWALSVRHPKIDICDSIATINMSGTRIREPYPLSEAPVVVADSHANCICTNLPFAGHIAEVRNEMQENYEAGLSAPITPISAMFMYWMYGETIMYLR